MALLERIEQKSFLGTEFATWLWYTTEASNGKIDIGCGKACEVAFEKDLLLSGDFGESLASTFKGDAPSMAPEAAAALAAGKKVKRAKIRINLDDTPWILTLNGENFDWGSLRIEMPPSLPFVEAVPLRLKALEEFQQVFSKLFDHFLSVRLMEEKWPKELKKMKAWVVSKCEPASGERE